MRERLIGIVPERGWYSAAGRGKRRYADDKEFQKHQIVCFEGVQLPADNGNDGKDGGEECLHQIQRGGVLDIVDDAPALEYDARHGREVVVKEDDVAHVFGGVAAGGDADGAICLFHGEDIVHAVARHGDRISFRLDGFYQDRFLFGRNAAEDGIFVGNGNDFLFVEPLQRDVLFCIGYADALCDFRCCK